MNMKIKTTDVIYREDLYPRSETDPARVQAYAENLEVMPPIEINQNNILIDGWHRWTAHKKMEVDLIGAVVTETPSESELYFLAIERNSKHGMQLSAADKRDKARGIYHATPVKQRKEMKHRLASLFSVTNKTISAWLSRIDKDTKEQQKKQIFDLWLACHTQQEIAKRVGWTRDEIRGVLGNMENFPKSPQHTHTDNFQPPIYNVWKTQNKSNGVGHFGNTEAQWLDNLLYLYTDPFDIVIDPFAGGGSTIDVCKKRGRRYWVSDRKPIVEREHEIRKHDVVVDGVAGPTHFTDVKFVYLDPPYWKQAENKYSTDQTDLANMDIDEFNKELSSIIRAYADKLKVGHIALVMQPTQWNAPGRRFFDHVGDMLRSVKLPVDMRYSVPYESQQCTAQMVLWAKENKRCLVLTREIIVWRIS